MTSGAVSPRSASERAKGSKGVQRGRHLTRTRMRTPQCQEIELSAPRQARDQKIWCVHGHKIGTTGP